MIAAGALACAGGPAAAQYGALPSPYTVQPYGGSSGTTAAQRGDYSALPSPYSVQPYGTAMPAPRAAQPSYSPPAFSYNPPPAPASGPIYTAPAYTPPPLSVQSAPTPERTYVAPPASQTVPQAAPAAYPSPFPPQTAQAPNTRSNLRILDEIKLGGLAHDIPFGGHGREHGADVNLEVLFASPAFFKYIWSPRPILGVDANTEGKTTNYYFGLAWDWDFWRPGWTRGDGFFASLALGGAIHDGKLDTRNRNRKSLGGRALFREGFDLGYHFNEHISLSAFVDHISNANLANRNEGLTNAGMRIGYRF